jgi:hypothetical protein
MAFLRQNRLPQDTICTRRNPAKRGNLEIVEGGCRLSREFGGFPLFWCIRPKKKSIISPTFSDRFLNTILPGGAFSPVLQGIRKTGL